MSIEVPQELINARRFANREARLAILQVAETQLRPMQMARLRVLMLLRPVKTQAAIDTVTLNAQAMGLVDAEGEVMEAANWSRILEIILELLPIILKLFGL